jgi:predicted nucleic acid-binding protein
MIVLIEANFVLELAFQQEEADEADRVVTFAETGRIQLVVPACALFEPYETLARRRKGRDATLARLRNELAQVARSKTFRNLAETSRAVTDALAESGEVEAKGLETTIRRLTSCATISPLTKSVIETALEYQAQFELEPQDAIVMASVDEHLKQCGGGHKVFVNKNHRDFLTPEIVERMGTHDCRLLPRISGARQYIEQQI